MYKDAVELSTRDSIAHNELHAGYGAYLEIGLIV